MASFLPSLYDRPIDHSPHNGRRPDSGRGIRLHDAEKARCQLVGSLPVSQREDALVQRIAGKRHIQMFRLRQRRQRRAVRHGARAFNLPRCAMPAGKKIPHRDTGTRTNRRRKTTRKRARKPTDSNRVRCQIFRRDTAQHRRRSIGRHELPARTRFQRRHHTQIPHRLRAGRVGHARRCSQRPKLQPRLYGKGQCVQLQRREKTLLRHISRPRHFSVDYRQRQSGGILRTRLVARHKRRCPKICQHQRNTTLCQKQRTIRHSKPKTPSPKPTASI